jgi:hypothetical protein
VLKQVSLFLLFFALPVFLFAQPDSLGLKKDTIKKDTLKIDSLKKDMLKKEPAFKKTIKDNHTNYDTIITHLLAQNRFLNIKGKPVAADNQLKHRVSKDFLFFLLLSLVFILAFFRLFYQRYFTNLFRVFFNTSLRQSQLTDQLTQAKLPSLFFNLFFTITGGIYVYFLLRYFQWISPAKMITVLVYCVASLIIVYAGKFIVLKFTGWLTGYNEAANTYLFVIFLINKILGILLMPVIIILAFSQLFLVKAIVPVSLLMIGLLLVLRFFRSYGLLQKQLKVSGFHFFLYIAGTEILPLLLIYKGLLILVS